MNAASNDRQPVGCTLRDVVKVAAQEGRNVLPDATDDQAAVIEAWALAALRGTIH